MSGKKNVWMAAAGILIGLAMSGPAAHAAEAFLKALPSTNTFYLDGQQIELEAYVINGNNYVRLRDVGEAVGFNVYWDGAVQIDSDAPYTGEAPGTPAQPEAQPPAVQDSYTISAVHWSREDLSQEANPAVFTGVYDRELYNAIRQTLVDGSAQSEAGYRYAYTMVSGSEYSAVKNLLGRMEGVLRYEWHVPQNLANYYEYPDHFAVSARMPENYQAALDFIQPVIAEVERMDTDREKVEYLNDCLRALLTYDSSAAAGITQTFSRHSGELKAACGSYARAFRFLCAAADIPCITISTASHTWNLVCADGKWLHVDVSANDLYGRNTVLLTETVPNRIDQTPEATAFLKELLAPGSTK